MFSIRSVRPPVSFSPCMPSNIPWWRSTVLSIAPPAARWSRAGEIERPRVSASVSRCPRSSRTRNIFGTATGSETNFFQLLACWETSCSAAYFSWGTSTRRHSRRSMLSSISSIRSWKAGRAMCPWQWRFETRTGWVRSLPGGFALDQAIWVLTDQAWMPSPLSIVNKQDAITGPVAYVRLLGDRAAVDALTTTLDHIVIDRSEQLREDAEAIQLIRGRVPVLIFVNNHFAGYSPATIKELPEVPGLFRELRGRFWFYPSSSAAGRTADRAPPCARPGRWSPVAGWRSGRRRRPRASSRRRD